jgi:two-component SAPR family response regulator
MSDAEGKGYRVLVVEDDAFIAMDIEDVLRRAGYEVVGPVATQRQAIALLGEGGIDLAVINIGVSDGPAYAVAGTLAARSVPFIFVTGYADSEIPGDFREYPLVRKPFTAETLLDAIAAARPD